jgi:hypothetical protein
MSNKLIKLLISSTLIGLFFTEVRPAFASKQTDQLWQQALTGREVSNTTYASSSIGSTYTNSTSTTSMHFCPDNKIVVGGEFTISGSSVAAHRNRPLVSGTWKIIKSDKSSVVIKFGDGRGASQLGVISISGDKLYSGLGRNIKILEIGKSNIC